MDIGAWKIRVHRVTKSQALLWLNSSEACIGPFQKVTAFVEDAAWLGQFMEKCEYKSCQTTVLISKQQHLKYIYFLKILKLNANSGAR